MRDDRLAVLVPDVENQPVLLDADMQSVRAIIVADRCERVLLDQIVNRGGALMLDVRAGTADRAFVKRHRDEPVVVFGFGGCHRRLRRIATERAWASRPSASPSAIAEGPSAASCSGPHLRSEVRFMKSSTPSPDENRAERAVGSTWFEPAT